MTVWSAVKVAQKAVDGSAAHVARESYEQMRYALQEIKQKMVLSRNETDILLNAVRKKNRAAKVPIFE